MGSTESNKTDKRVEDEDFSKINHNIFRETSGPRAEQLEVLSKTKQDLRLTKQLERHSIQIRLAMSGLTCRRLVLPFVG